MNKIINLTPHEVSVILEDRAIHFPVSGTVARCDCSKNRIGILDGIPINKSTYGDVSGLPKQADGVYYIVSSFVANALPERKDLLYPDDLVRDDTGAVIGCKGFGRA